MTFALAFSLSFSCFAALPVQNTPLRVMSYNVRFANPFDGINTWDNRKGFLVETVKAFDPDLLGTQEALAGQRDDLARQLDGYEVVSAGRDDGLEKGEMMAVFYKKSRFEKLDGGHFWLSETPDVAGSKSWDSSLPRMVTWLKLRDRTNPDVTIAYFNTHFDHRGPQARLEAAKLVRKRMAKHGKGCRVILTGDFNTDEGTEPYQAMFADSEQLIDTYRRIHQTKGPDEGTFTNFKAGATSGPRIDWIGCSPDWKVKDATIDPAARDGRTPSDHHAVTAVLD